MLLYDTEVAPNPRQGPDFSGGKGRHGPHDQRRPRQDGAQAGRPYSKVNALQRTPSLVLDDGTTIAESVAICRYFEELHPEPPLFGVGALGKAMVEMWHQGSKINLMMPTAMVFRHTHPAMAALEVPQIAQVAETNRPRVLDFLAILDAHLAGSHFAAGETYSIADITGLVGMDFLRLARIHPPQELKNVARWHGELSARPSAAA